MLPNAGGIQPKLKNCAQVRIEKPKAILPFAAMVRMAAFLLRKVSTKTVLLQNFGPCQTTAHRMMNGLAIGLSEMLIHVVFLWV